MTAGMLAMTVFCCVSGGPFGLEPLISATGAGFALLLILVVPILWAIPDSLITAELAPAIPEEGGYIIWVRRAMGPFAGFVNGWWTFLYSLLDATIYPVLFSTYLWSLLRPFVGEGIADALPVRWLTSLAVIIAFTFLNIRGTRLVGRTSIIFAWLIIVPFALLCIVGFAKLSQNPRPIGHEFLLPGMSPMQAISGGLAIALWNYLGWDNLSTIAEEVEEPAKAYPKALGISLILITAIYVFPTIVGLAFVPNAAQWTDGSWPEIAQAVGGPVLKNVMIVAALVSPVALFMAALLASSRVPFVLAEKGFLPRKLMRLHPKYGTPVTAILACSVVYACLAFEKFEDLVELNVIMYCAALTLESISLLILRYKEPTLPRPFKIPGGIPVVALVVLLPISMVCLLVYAMIDEARQNPDVALVRQQLALVTVFILSGPAIYAVQSLIRSNPDD